MVPFLCEEENRVICNLSTAKKQNVLKKISSFEFIPESTVRYLKAEVTRGGVSTKKISSKTMEVQEIEGLYFIGEVLDVTGELGGYNLHWAWASAMTAAQHINQKGF